VFAWAEARPGEIYMFPASVNLTRQGVSVTLSMVAGSWRQRWRKEEAISMVLTCLRQGELALLLTMWLGDGKARWGRIGRFEIAVAAR
jgi:hypothetical protein